MLTQPAWRQVLPLLSPGTLKSPSQFSFVYLTPAILFHSTWQFVSRLHSCNTKGKKAWGLLAIVYQPTPYLFLSLPTVICEIFFFKHSFWNQPGKNPLWGNNIAVSVHMRSSCRLKETRVQKSSRRNTFAFCFPFVLNDNKQQCFAFQGTENDHIRAFGNSTAGCKKRPLMM